MDTRSAAGDDDAGGEPVTGLTIGELARAVGLPSATIRSWERRYAFPSPHRRSSGHRRYDQDDVASIRSVVRARDHGVPLPRAIAQLAADGTGAPSIFAQVRERHPDVPVWQVRKSTLLALTWAIEDECCARAQQPLLIGSFQHQRFFRRAESRWLELARTASRTVVFAAAVGPEDEAGGIDFVPLSEASSMRREWTVVCDAPDGAAVLAAWELPGQTGRRDRDRLFEALWTVDPAVVRSAARAGAALAGILEEEGVEQRLREPTTAASRDAAQVLRTFARMVDYLERPG